MANYMALFSIVFTMSFVVLFDDVHRRNRCNRVLSSLLSRDELDRLRTIWEACQES